VITTAEELKKKRKLAKLTTAEKYGIPIHKEDFLDKELKAFEKKKSSPKKKTPAKAEPPLKKKKPNPKPTTFIRPAVDSKYEENYENPSATVFGSETEGFYTAVLARADLGDGEIGKNSFYIVQIIQDTSAKNKFIVYRRWGRVGEEGSDTAYEHKTKEKAIAEFCKMYFSLPSFIFPSIPC
jgi:predicted DNA-binding WGR domain protein